jgi:putative transposase
MEAPTPCRAYPSDLTDAQGALPEPLLLPPVPAGAPRTTDLREVVNAILYCLHNGCAWRALPHGLPPEGTVRHYFHRWRRQGLWEQINDALRHRVRRAEGRAPEPSGGVVDNQSVQGTRTRSLRGDDAAKQVTGTNAVSPG